MPPSPGLSGPGKGGGRGGGTVLGDLEGCVGWYLSSPGSHPSRVSYPGRASARTPSLAPGAQAPLGPPGPRPGPGPARRGRTAPSSLRPAPPPLPLMTGRIKFFSTRDSGGGGLGPLVTSLRPGRRKDGLREPPRGSARGTRALIWPSRMTRPGPLAQKGLSESDIARPDPGPSGPPCQLFTSRSGDSDSASRHHTAPSHDTLPSHCKVPNHCKVPSHCKAPSHYAWQASTPPSPPPSMRYGTILCTTSKTREFPRN